MTTLEYKLLGLLARQPMSGYDLASHLKQRFVPFGPISHTQIYPALASLEQKGLVRYHVVEQHAVRPDKKVYEPTEEGLSTLRQWVESPTPLVFLYDEFFLKAYSEQADFFEGREVLFQYMIGYEHNYLAWCQAVLQYLEQRKHAHEEGN
jgi:DNA-binding PadR family transcriptional regulator